MKEAIQRYFTKGAIVPTNPNTGDIRNYLAMKLERDDKLEAMSDD